MFDICDGKNRYSPCPQCGGAIGMGILTRKETRLVVHDCGFEGPAVAEKIDTPWWQADKEAFDAWNQLPRGAVQPT